VPTQLTHNRDQDIMSMTKPQDKPRLQGDDEQLTKAQRY
jgi:hypothetical protein